MVTERSTAVYVGKKCIARRPDTFQLKYGMILPVIRAGIEGFGIAILTAKNLTHVITIYPAV